MLPYQARVRATRRSGATLASAARMLFKALSKELSLFADRSMGGFILSASRNPAEKPLE